MRVLHAQVCVLYAPLIPETPIKVDAGEFLTSIFGTYILIISRTFVQYHVCSVGLTESGPHPPRSHLSPGHQTVRGPVQLPHTHCYSVCPSYNIYF